MEPMAFLARLELTVFLDRSALLELTVFLDRLALLE